MTPQEVTAHILERAPLSFSRASAREGNTAITPRAVPNSSWRDPLWRVCRTMWP